MVRETRHLLIGNLPSNLNEERIIEHFKKYGKVQSVKFLSKEQNSSCNNDYCATIAFIDIKSASKAHNAENKIEERVLKTNYYEPPANLTSSSAIFIHESRGDLIVDNSNNLTGSTVTNSNQSLQNQSSSQTIRSSVVSRHLLTNSNRLTDDRIYDRISNDNSYKRHYNDDNRRTNSNNRIHHDSERNNSHFRQYNNRNNVGSTNSSSNHFTESRYSNNLSNNLTSNSINNSNTNNSNNSNNELDDCNININSSTNSGSISQRLFSCSSRNNSSSQGTCGNTSNNICNNSNNGRGLSSNVLNNCSTMNGSSSLINLPSVVSNISSLNGNNLNSMISPTVTSPGSSSSSFHLNSNSQTGSAVGVAGKSATSSASLSMLTKKTITSSNLSTVSSSNNKKAKKKKKKRKKSSSSSYHQSSSHHHNHGHRSGGSSTPSSTAQLSSNISGSYHHNPHNSSSSTSRKHHHLSRSVSTVQDALSYNISSGRHGNTSSRSISPSSVESSEKEQNCLLSTRCSSSMSCSDLEDEHHTHHSSHHIHSHHSHHNNSLHNIRNDNATNQLHNNLSGSIVNSCGNVNSNNSGQPVNNEQIGNHLGTNNNVQQNSSNHHHHSHFHLSSSNSSNSSGNCGINNHNSSSTGLLQASAMNNSSNLNSQSQISSNNNGSNHHNQFVLSNVHSPIDDDDANTPISPNSSTSNLSSASSSRVSSRRCSLSPPMSLSKKHSTNGSLRFSSYKNSAHLSNSSNNCSSVTPATISGINSNSFNNLQSSPENVSNSAITNQSSKLNSNTSSLHYNQFSQCNNSESNKINSEYNTNIDYNEKELFSDQNTNNSNNLSSGTNNNGKPLAICVRNLPVRSTDTSLKDGLFHEYKKHGKVTMVKVIGQGTDRFAVVCFKKNEDVEKALEVSRDKQFFGCKIEVTPHEGLDGEDNDFRPLEAELDEYHPKATRTLFVGNLEKDITTSQLRQHFEQFGEIIEIDIKKQGTSTYAFIQYSDIFSVVKAMRKLDGENLGNSANRIKLGFGKSMPTNCVWLHGISESTSEKTLNRQCSRFGSVSNLIIDRQKGNCLVFYDTIELAQITVTDLKGRLFNNKRLQVDFASRECQNSFYQKLENNTNTINYSSHLSSNRNNLMSISNHNSSAGNSLNNSINNTNPNYEKGTNTNRITNRLNSLNNSPNNNLPPLPHTQWSNTRSQRSSENYNRAQPTSTCSNLNSSSSRHNSNNNTKNFDVLNEDYASSFDTDFFEEQNVHSNLISSHSNNSNSASDLRNSRSSEFPEEKLRGRSSSPHRALECSENNLSKNERQNDEKNLFNKNDDFPNNIVKERFNRRNSEDSSYENWKTSDQTDRHFYKNRNKNSSVLNQSSTHYHHFHHREENINFRNSLSNANFKRHSQSISPPSPSNSSSHVNIANEPSSVNENIHSSLSKRKIVLPLVLPLPEFALNCRLDSKFSSNFKDSSNKDLKDNFNKISSLESNSKNDVLKPLSIKCEDNTSKENTIMSPLNSLSPVHVNFHSKNFSRSKSENINSINPSDFVHKDKESLVSNNDLINKKSKKGPYSASPQSPLAINSSSINNKNNNQPNVSNTLSKSLSFEERIKALDEKFSVWSNTNSNSNSNLDKEVSTSSTLLCSTNSINQTNKNNSTIVTDDSSKLNEKSNINPSINKNLEDLKVLCSNNETNLTEAIMLNTPTNSTTLTIDYSKYNIKKKSQTNSACNSNSARSEPSDIVKSLLSKSSIFDQDSKRLEHINEKYEPKEAGVQSNNNVPVANSQPSPKTESAHHNTNQANSKSQSNVRTKAAAKEFVCNQASSSSSNVLEKDDNSKSLNLTEPSNDSKKEISTTQDPKLLPTNKTTNKVSNESENLVNNQSKNTNKDNVKDEKINKKSSSSVKENISISIKDKEHKKANDNVITSKSQVSSNVHSKKKEKESNHHLKADKKIDKKFHTSSLDQNKLDVDRQLIESNKKSNLKSEKNDKEKAGANTSSNAHGKEKEGEKEISIKRKEKFLKEKHSSTSSMKDLYKSHIDFDKDQDSQKIKKSKKSMSLDSSNNEINAMSFSKTSKDHEKDSENQKPTKLKKSYNKDNTIDFEEFMIDKETERATKRYLAEMKKLGITEAPTYFSMYDKVKARSSQNQSLKGQSSANNSGSSINRNKSDSDCFKTKSERDSDGSGSNSDSSDDENHRLIKSVKRPSFSIDKNESKDSQSSDDEILFQPVSRNKSNKLNLNHRKRKVNCIQSSQSSSNETSSTSSDSEKEQKHNYKESSDLKSKKKLRKHQLSKTTAVFNWNTDSDDDEVIKPIKNKNSINPACNLSKKSKNNQALSSNQDKKDKESSKDSKECDVTNNRKRSLHDDSFSSIKATKDERSKKKKIQKNTSVENATESNTSKGLEKDKENDFKLLIKEEKSKSFNSKNDSIDSDDLSVNLHSSKNVLKKKKKKKDKLSKQKDGISSKNKETLIKEGQDQLSPKICKQLKEDLEMSESDSDALSSFKFNSKPSKDLKSMRKEEFYLDQNSNKKQKDKVNKIEETNKDKKIVLKESKKSFSSSDSDFENFNNTKESKHVKKQKKEKREKSRIKEKDIDLDKSHDIDKDNEKDKMKEVSKEKIREKDKLKEKERDKNKEKSKEKDKIKEKSKEKTKNKSKFKDKNKDNDNENNLDNHKTKIKTEKIKDELVNEKSELLNERKIKVDKDLEEKTDSESKFSNTHFEKDINKDIENKVKNKLKKSKNKNKHRNKNKYDSDNDGETESELKSSGKNKLKSDRENDSESKTEMNKDNDKKQETKVDYGYERLTKKEIKAAKESETKVKKQSFSESNIFSNKEQNTGNEKDSQSKFRKDSSTDICKNENKLEKESKLSQNTDSEKLKLKDFDEISSDFDTNFKEKIQEKHITEEKTDIKINKTKNESKTDHKDKNSGTNLSSISHKPNKKKDVNAEKDHKHKESAKNKSKEFKNSNKSEDFILSKDNFSKTKSISLDNTYLADSNKHEVVDQNKSSSNKSNIDHKEKIYSDCDNFKDSKYLNSNKNNTLKSFEKLQRNDNDNLDNANDLWVNEETPKCDIWSDITKSEESFTQYLNKGSISSTDEWGESDDEILSKYSLLSPLSNLPTKSMPTLPVNINQSSSSQSVISKDVLKTIKSPKNQETLSFYQNESTTQNISKQRKKEFKNKEDKCKENNDERKKKTKKPKEHRDQKIKEEKKLSLNNEIYEKNIEKSSNLSVSEIKTEPIIAAAATIQSQIFFNSADTKTKTEKSCLMQPASPFAEKHVQQMNTYPCKQNQRLLSEGNIILNSNKKELKDFDQIKINEILNEKRVLSPVKTNTEKDGTNNKILIKSNEMMFSISEESSNDEFLPAIGISFSSNSSNSSINLTNTSNNPSFSNIASLSKKDEKSLLEKNQSVRKYEEEAAIETKRLEAELSKSKDSGSNWKSFKDSNKEFFLDSINNERLNSSNNSSTSLVNLNTPINKVIPKKPNKSIILEDATAIFNVITSGEVKDPFLDSDETHFKVTDCKDELDDQRKIEDDLAVSALLELEMNNDEVLSSQENVESPEISKTTKTSSSSTISRENLESTSKDLNQPNTIEVTQDEETNRLQIAEDLLNENSVDSDVFHSAPDDLPDAENTLKDNKKSQDLLCTEQEKLYPAKLSLSNNNIIKSEVTSNLPSKLNSSDSKLKVCSRSDSNKPEVYKENILDKEIDSTLTKEENLEKSLKNFKTSSLINELVKKGLKNKEEIYLASKTEASFLHSKISINQKEIELPTSLAEVKQAIASTIIKKEDIKPSSVKEDHLDKSEKQIASNLLCPLPEIQSNQIDVNNKLEEDSLVDESKVLTCNTTKSNTVTVEQQRPKRGRKAKARKSSESEESFKLNPLSPNSLNLSSPLISPTSTQPIPLINLQTTNSSSTSFTNKLNERLRRSTRGLSANSELTTNVADEPQNESLLEETTNNNVEEDNVMSTDGKRKRGRKKKFENLINTKTIETKTSTHSNNSANLMVETNLESNKNLSPYDVFEFNDSEEETSTTLPLMTLHGNTTKSNEQNKNNLSANTSFLMLTANSQENQKPDSIDLSSSILNDVYTDQPKSILSSSQASLPFNNQDSSQLNLDSSITETNQNSCDKEYTTELSQHGKLSITIRLQQKDKEQINLENVSESFTEEKTSEDNNSNDLYSSVQKPMTRKSARLMSQVNKTTIDEVIEDVVKGIFDENIDSRNFDSDILELEEDAFLNDYFEKSNELNTEEDLKNNKDSKNSRITRSSVAKSTNNLDESVNDDSLIESNEKNLIPNVTKVQTSVINTSVPVSSEVKIETDEIIENKTKTHIVNESKTETTNLTSLTQVINSSKTPTTVITNHDISTLTTNDSELQNKRTVLKVELPINPFINKISSEREITISKPNEEIKKEETQISVNKVNLPILAKNTPCPNININNSSIDNSKLFTSQSPKITTEGISVMKVIVPEKDTKSSLNTIIQTIPNISERIHNSTTALKLKTGKGLNLEESSLIQSINLSKNQISTNNSDIVPSTTVKSSTIDTSVKNNISMPQIDHLVTKPTISVDFTKNSFVSTSVISTINNPVNQNSNSIRPLCSKSLNLSKQTANLVISQANVLPSSSVSTSIASINPDQNDETSELHLQHQMKIKNAKPSQLLLPTNHFSGQIPNQELSLLHQQMLLMQQHPQQQFLTNAYAAAAAALHPELRMPLNHLSPRFNFSPLNTANVLEKELEESKQLHQVKPQLQSQINKIKSKQISDHQEKVIQELGSLENMHPPSLLNSLRLPVNVSHPSNPMTPNFASIRGPLPTHLLSPHESNQQQQRFTESPAIIHGNVNSFSRTPLLSPSLKEMKPQLIPQAHANPNKPFEVPQRPHSTFSVSTINSPSPGFQNNLLPANSSVAPTSQLSPSLNYRKDLPSPMNVMDISEQIHLPRKLHKAYAVSQQQNKDAANMMLNNILPYHSLPMPAHQSNPVNLHLPPNPQHTLIPNTGLSYQQQQVSNIALQQINSQINNPIEFSQPQPSGGDSVLIQKYPKLWQGLLALKNDQAAVQMHFVTGNSIIAQNALPPILADGTGAVPLRIAQRMRLEQTQLDGVCRKMQQVDEHCILLALPCGRDHMDVISQSNNLRTGFIQYLQSKQAAGIINTNTPGTNQPAYVVHIFPSCEFSNENLARIAPDLLVSIAEIAHLLVVIATV